MECVWARARSAAQRSCLFSLFSHTRNPPLHPPPPSLTEIWIHSETLPYRDLFEVDQVFSQAFGYTLNRLATDITYLLLIGVGMRVLALGMMLTLVGGLQSALDGCPLRRCQWRCQWCCQGMGRKEAVTVPLPSGAVGAK